MPTPTETAKAIVREWATWADRGMYIANGMIDRKALDRLEASIATSMASMKAAYADELALARTHISALQSKPGAAVSSIQEQINAASQAAKPKRKPKESAE